MAHQSLYRRYRPRTFAEVKGQQHVVTALRNAVDSDSAAHAYLFSGPRGTGKTSTARIFAKALNCTSLRGGDPCCECDSCVAMEAGRSFDLFELDAASNNRVDAMRDLVERAMVASPGRTKVYILDEVHMLSPGASNALLKTLEEPPAHVRFVLATTDPQKVLPTIRSRTQHFEFRLLSTEELAAHARWVAADAGLVIDEESLAHAVRAGRGSVRDMLSALDQVVATGGVVERPQPIDDLFSALAQGSEGSALVAVADAISHGHDPRNLAQAFVAEIREAFLLSIGVGTSQLVDSDRERLGGWAEKLGSPRLSKALERIGSAIVDMRSAADPRVPLEVALIQLMAAPPPSSTEVSNDGVSGGAAEVVDLRKRVERLEAAIAQGQGVSGARGTDTPDGPGVGGEDSASQVSAAGAGGSAGPSKAAAARAALKQTGRAKPPPPPPRMSRSGKPAERGAKAQPGPEPAVAATGGSPTVAPSDAPLEAPSEEPRAEPAASVAPVAPVASVAQVAQAGQAERSVAASIPDRDTLVMAFGDSVVPKLKGIAKAIYTNGRFVSVTGDHAEFAVENAPTLDRAERYRAEVEALLAAELSVPVPLRLVVDTGENEATRSGTPSAANPGTQDVGAPAQPGSPAAVGDASVSEEAEIMAQVSELEDADVETSTVDRLTAAFPGAELIESEEMT